MQVQKICLLFCIISLSTAKTPTKYIFTGPPGAGKTTLLLGLETHYNVDIIREAAADIIALELAQNINEPWKDPAFDAKILSLQLKRFTQTNSSNRPLLCDRSPIDIYAYCSFHNTPLPAAINHHVAVMLSDPTISKTVLFIESLGSIHRTAIRAETIDDAKKIESLLYKYYTLFGFTIVRIPPLPLTERIHYALEALSLKT